MTTRADMNKWFPVLHTWPDVTDGQLWQGSSTEPLKTVRITPSAEHRGFFHYSITRIATGEIEETSRPVAGHALRSFLEHEGIDPEQMAWASTEPSHA